MAVTAVMKPSSPPSNNVRPGSNSSSSSSPASAGATVAQQPLRPIQPSQEPLVESSASQSSATLLDSPSAPASAAAPLAKKKQHRRFYQRLLGSFHFHRNSSDEQASASGKARAEVVVVVPSMPLESQFAAQASLSTPELPLIALDAGSYETSNVIHSYHHHNSDVKDPLLLQSDSVTTLRLSSGNSIALSDLFLTSSIPIPCGSQTEHSPIQIPVVPLEQLTKPKAATALAASASHGSLNSSFDEKYHFCSGRKILGRGGSSVVRLAKGDDNKIYAVKEFRKRRKEENPRDYVKKLTSEYCISSLLHHVNIVETYDILREGNHWYEIMEYCPGGDLFSLIRDGVLSSSDEVDACFRQLLEGVHYMHSIGVAHRDLKPENLLIDAHGHLKISDFGVSEVFRVCWEKTDHLSKGIRGSAPYIAPEVLAGGEYDPAAADIWSCGIIYYAMIFHGIPWTIADSKDPNYRHYLKHRGIGFEPLVRLPHGPQVLLRKMLEPDPMKRISVFDIMKDEWILSIETDSVAHRFANMFGNKCPSSLSSLTSKSK